MPKTERKDTLKIYGEAELTVSEPAETVAVTAAPDCSDRLLHCQPYVE